MSDINHDVSIGINQGLIGDDHWKRHDMGFSWEYGSEGICRTTYRAETNRLYSPEVKEIGKTDNVCIYNGDKEVYPSSYIDNKEDHNMSFVGITWVNGQIIAFADTKGTIRDKHGDPVHDADRGIVPKIFQNDQFICVTCGSNEFLDLPSSETIGDKSYIRLEDWIGCNLHNGESIAEFFGKMHTYFTEYAVFFPDISFIATNKTSKGCFEYYYITVAFGKHLTMEYHADKGDDPIKCVYTGDKMYVGLFDNTNKLRWCGTPEQIKDILEKTIAFFDQHPEILPYNPVGLPVAVTSVES